jgi:opacity protein-like surface antigen
MVSMRRHTPLIALAAVLTGCTAILTCSAARADDTNVAQLAATVKALQARLAAVEAENRQIKREIATDRGQPHRLVERGPVRAAAAVSAPAAAVPSGVYDMATGEMATKAPFAPPVPSWEGAYAGAAFGAGWMHAKSTQTSTFTDLETNTGPGFSDVFTTTGGDVASLSGSGPGAMVNLFVGYNWMLTSNFLIGGQIEGGVSNIRAKVSGADPFTRVETTVDTPPGGVAGTSVSTESGIDSFTDNIDNRWLISALARAGWVVDSRNLIYALAGPTYGRFEWSTETFGMFGGTVGAGFERKIAPMWTLRVEYRYTKFANHTINTGFSETGSAVSTGAFTGTQTFTDSGATSNTVSADMQSIMFGISREFGPY